MLLCVDFQALNEGMVADTYPMGPSARAYYERREGEVHNASQSAKRLLAGTTTAFFRLLTAFTCHRGQFAWTVMPFGPKNAVQTFQRAMNELLKSHTVSTAVHIWMI